MSEDARVEAGKKLIALLDKYNSSGPANGAAFDVYCIFHEDAPMIVAELMPAIPPDQVVVSRDDLRAVLEAFVWTCEAYAGEYGSDAEGRDASPGSTFTDFDMTSYDRLQTKVDQP